MNNASKIKLIEFKPHGLGKEWHCKCFVCGQHVVLGDALIGYANNKKEAEQILELFDLRAKMANWKGLRGEVKVSIVACPKHLPNLELLEILVHEQGLISSEILKRTLPKSK